MCQNLYAGAFALCTNWLAKLTLGEYHLSLGPNFTKLKKAINEGICVPEQKLKLFGPLFSNMKELVIK